MRFNTLDYSNIKNGSSEPMTLGPITVFTGPSRSGKSAAMDASSLAATNVCLSSGSSVEKQKLVIRNGYTAARARMYGEGLKAEWRIYDKRHWQLECDGMNCTSVNGMLPTTFKDFLAMTGEDKWRLIEKVIGKFSTPEPPSTDAIEAEIKKLEKENEGRTYTGRSEEAVLVLAYSIEALLNEQQEMAKNAGYKKQRSEQAKQRIAQFARDLDGIEKKHIEDIVKLEEIKDKKTKMELALKEVMESPVEELLAYGSTPEEAGVSITKEFAANMQMLVSILPEEKRDKIFNPEFDSVEEVVKDLIDILRGEVFPEVDMSKFVQLTGIKPVDTEQCRQLVKDITASHDALESRINRWKAEMVSLRNEMATLNAEIDLDASEFEKLLSPLEISAKMLELNALRQEAGEAAAFKHWLAGVKDRTEKILELQQELEVAKAAIAKFKESKQAYINSAKDAAVFYANEVLGLMSLPLVNIEADMRGSRSTLSITVDGVDMAVIAGSERVIYGSLVLWSIIHALKPKVPLLWIEAAEMDLPLLCNFVNAMSLVTKRHSLGGNVFIASHMNCVGYVVQDNVSVVDFSAPIG